MPVVIVETGLEEEENLQGGARWPVLEAALRKYGMSPKGVICVVSIQGKSGEHREVYEWSQQQLRELISRFLRKKPWSTKKKDRWLANTYEETYNTGKKSIGILCYRGECG